MLVQLSRTARAGAARVARRNAFVQMRGFIAPTVSRRADFVQELYLKELKAYKAPAVKESDSAGQVQTFAVPKTPKSPEEAELASGLKEYESMAVEVDGGAAAAPGETAAVEDWYEAEEEEDAHASGH